MPDWTYQTVLKAPLGALGFDRGRNLALRSMGRLASLPGGRKVIQFMGHTQPDERLKSVYAKTRFRSPVGLGCGLDSSALAAQAFSEFGFGFIEVGPVVEDTSDRRPKTTTIDFQKETIACSNACCFLDADSLATRLRQHGPVAVPVFARLLVATHEAATRMMRSLDNYVEGYVVPAPLVTTLADRAGDKMLLARIDSDAWADESVRDSLLTSIRAKRVEGVVIASDGSQLGKATYAESVSLAAEVRREVGEEPLIIGSVGVHSPADALDYLDAGADMVQVDSGIVIAGPSLPKRINEAILYRQNAHEDNSLTRPVPQQSWFWAFLMGLGMFVGGVMAMAIALTRVVMPYDESLVGMLRGELMRINDRLLPFMQHDRVTLAGTMLAIGVLYAALAFHGIRRGSHWAYIAIVISATTGFFSFFTFLGFGYFDPFHAFVSAVLLQFLLLTTVLPQPTHQAIRMPDLWNDSRWQLHQWGQLAFVAHGAVLIIAGVVISVIGMTDVFVPEDLEFLQCSQRVLAEANPMLIPLVAHDRATFGGMLIASGIVTLLSAMWGFGHGRAWLWWSLMIAGNLAYLSTIGIHWAVGYDSLWHLIPAYGGFALLWLGGLASYPFMVQTDVSLQAEWQRRLEFFHSVS